MAMYNQDKCKTTGYGSNSQEVKGDGPAIMKGYWLWWCGKHAQPLAWCEKDRLKLALMQAEANLDSIALRASHASDCSYDGGALSICSCGLQDAIDRVRENRKERLHLYK